jgi:hypothetical protein
MAAIEVVTWVLLGALLSMTLPGPKRTKLVSAVIGAIVGGTIGRGLAWQAAIAGFSVSALLIVGIAAIVVFEIGLVLTKRSDP